VETLESDHIIAVTLEMARKRGLTRVSMRQIAAELGVTATALYYHFRNKNELLDRVIGHIMESIAVPDPRLPWTDRVRQLVLRQMQTALAYPGLARFLVHHRDSLGALRWTETILEVLHDAGFRGAGLKSALATLSFFVHPLALADERPQAGPVAMIQHKRVAKRVKIEPSRYPHLIELLPELADYSYDHYMPVALDSVIAGLVAARKRTAARPRTPRALPSR
jgi:TetR/AcrR family tetracycline transcriptional repressor